ncbi:hypothetical protein IQ243_10900 [Nostocales cyanobacterium LEGE 11386]|nr:hypothetical protein [Nostocales cyanobacterium LEGE 11386]
MCTPIINEKGSGAKYRRLVFFTQQRQMLQVGKAAQCTGSTLRSAAAASTELFHS